MTAAGRTFLASALLVLPATAAPSVPDDNRLEFTIFRDGDPIGSHRLAFHRRGDRLTVDIRVEIAVRVAFITIYRRTERKREVWRNGVLVRYEARSDDDGEESSVSAWVIDGRLMADGPEGRRTVPVGTIASTYWNVRTVEQARLLDSATGEVLRVSVADLGEEPVETIDGPVTARRYRVTGDLKRDLWYDRDGVWTAMRMEASDGSTIEYKRK